MITFKQAIEAARQAAREMFRAGTMQVEEIEMEDYNGRETWAITLSMDRESDFDGTSHHLAGPPIYFKRFYIDKENGDVLGARIRDVNVPA